MYSLNKPTHSGKPPSPPPPGPTLNHSKKLEILLFKSVKELSIFSFDVYSNLLLSALPIAVPAKSPMSSPSFFVISFDF